METLGTSQRAKIDNCCGPVVVRVQETQLVLLAGRQLLFKVVLLL